jgi:hypothetical protein
MVHHHQDGVIVQLKGGRHVMKSMEIENHGDIRINNG